MWRFFLLFYVHTDQLEGHRTITSASGIFVLTESRNDRSISATAMPVARRSEINREQNTTT